jgi:hypothetical protein
VGKLASGAARGLVLGAQLGDVVPGEAQPGAAAALVQQGPGAHGLSRGVAREVQARVDEHRQEVLRRAVLRAQPLLRQERAQPGREAGFARPPLAHGDHDAVTAPLQHPLQRQEPRIMPRRLKGVLVQARDGLHDELSHHVGLLVA